MTVPNNVRWFQVLLYLSLLLDALSAAFQDRTPDADTPESMILFANAVAACLIVLFAALVWLAAQHRKKWAQSVLVGALAFSALSLLQIIGDSGLQFSTVVDIVSTVLTAAGLYLSYTGDAKGWFLRGT